MKPRLGDDIRAGKLQLGSDAPTFGMFSAAVISAGGRTLSRRQRLSSSGSYVSAPGGGDTLPGRPDRLSPPRDPY